MSQVAEYPQATQVYSHSYRAADMTLVGSALPRIDCCPSFECSTMRWLPLQVIGSSMLLPPPEHSSLLRAILFVAGAWLSSKLLE